VQKPQVYKWTDAKGKTFYSQVKPPDVTQAQTVPVPQSTSNATSATDAPNTTNLTQRLNTQANQMAEERLAHARAMQELHRQDLNRIQQQQEYMSQQQSLAKQQEAAQALEGATQELERMKQELERKREHHTEEEHRYSYRPPSPPPLQAQTTIPEPPRPEWQPKPIPPFNPKEIGASR